MLNANSPEEAKYLLAWTSSRLSLLIYFQKPTRVSDIIGAVT